MQKIIDAVRGVLKSYGRPSEDPEFYDCKSACRAEIEKGMKTAGIDGPYAFYLEDRRRAILYLGDVRVNVMAPG